ncbi:hypothetical protein OBBRIDRAFT_794727 [Obba rivulosa]|uniref:Uncharacterized protein n=1 Tax=Obba rivulosa TaxID=1052685 RepID=A0A8E2AQX0_9APHY|nr:hypothetical protein OBBRIDRAFT_794727 [Obba rivulosa]
MSDAYRHLAGLIRAMSDSSFFTTTQPTQTVITNGDDYVAHVKSCQWDRKSIFDKEWSIHYSIIVPGARLSKNIYVTHAEKAGPKACQEALAVGIEWYVDNPDQFTHDVDALNYA